MKKNVFPLFGRFSRIEVIFAAVFIAMMVAMVAALGNAYEREAEDVAAAKQAASPEVNL